MYVIKRNGNKEILDFSNVRKQTMPACEGLEGCTYEEIELGINIILKDNIKTKEIQERLIESALNLITIDKPNYKYAAARLSLYDLYHTIQQKYNKDKDNDIYNNITLKDYLTYNKDILADELYTYTDNEIEELNKSILPENDLLYDYAGISLLRERYLAKGLDGEVVELPQHMSMGIAMYAMANENKEKRLEYVKTYYTYLSKLYIVPSTPVCSGARIKNRGLISCLVEHIDDNTESIMEVVTNVAQGSRRGSGFGINMSNIRATGSSIKNIKRASNGVIPFVKILNETLLSFNQLGSRSGSATVFIEWWHIDVFDFIDLRKKNGDPRRRAHDIFLAISLSDIFFTLLKENKTMVLFDPKDTPELLDTYGEEFNRHYIRYVEEFKNNKEKFNPNTTEIPTIELMKKICISYVEEGMPFLFFKDTVNRTNPNKELGIIRTSNLCVVGDTLVSVADGRIKVPIKELAEYSKGQYKFPVYCSSPVLPDKTKEIQELFWDDTIKEAVAFKTGTKKVIKLILANGNTITCTPDHKLALSTGGYLEAEQCLNKYLHYKDNKQIKVVRIVEIEEEQDVYCLTVDDVHNFYVWTSENDQLLIKNCQEITLPTSTEYTAVCNLSSINLARCNTKEDLTTATSILTRALDNFIDLTDYPNEKTRHTQKTFRSLGIGALGEAEYIATRFIHYGSEQHIDFIHFAYGIIKDISEQTSKELAVEKGSCIVEGKRNAYLRAIAPNASSGLLAGTTNSHEPVFNLVWKEENRTSSFKMTAPNLNKYNKKYYKNAYQIPAKSQLYCCSIRQQYIDQSISQNIYLFSDNNLKASTIKDLIEFAHKSGLKTLYYLRSNAPKLEDGEAYGYKVDCYGCD